MCRGLLRSVFRSASWGTGGRRTQISWVGEHYYLYLRTGVNSNKILPLAVHSTASSSGRPNFLNEAVLGAEGLHGGAVQVLAA
jgi:hypothetical protein